MPTTTALLPETVEPFVTTVYFRRLRMISPIFPSVLNVETSGRAFEEFLRVAGLGTLVLKPEGTAIAYDDPVQGARVRTVHITYALGFRVTMEMMDDEQHRVIARMPEELADATADHRERIAHGPFNDAFVGASFTGLDGLSLCNALHVNLKTGTTQSNALTPAVGLSVSGLQAAITAMEITQNDSDRFITLNPSMVFVPPALRFTADELLKSDMRPDTADNAINTVSTSQTGLMRKSSPYLTDADNWFLLADKMQHTVTWWNRKSPTKDSAVDFDTKDLKWTIHYRAAAAFYEWQGVLGSAP